MESMLHPHEPRQMSTPARLRILIDASNLHEGGAVQVASSFIEELALKMSHTPSRFEDVDIQLDISPRVASELSKMTLDGLNHRVLRTRPLRLSNLLPRSIQHDISFHIFGPVYSRRNATIRIMGFADGTSIFANPTRKGLTWRQMLRGFISRALTSKADGLIVESQRVAEALNRALGEKCPPTYVVPNAINSAILDESKWQAIPTLPSLDRELKLLAYPARLYPHKNHRALWMAGPILERKYGLRVRYAVTLTESEYETLPGNARQWFINVGALRIAQIPSLLKESDAVVFPSLLESYSAAPIEALASGLPLIACDRDYVRESCGSAPWYFDPRSPEALAESVYRCFADDGERIRRTRMGSRTAAAIPSAQERAEGYLQIILEAGRVGRLQ